jgi:hypothetical protein
MNPCAKGVRTYVNLSSKMADFGASDRNTQPPHALDVSIGTRREASIALTVYALTEQLKTAGSQTQIL